MGKSVSGRFKVAFKPGDPSFELIERFRGREAANVAPPKETVKAEAATVFRTSPGSFRALLVHSTGKHASNKVESLTKPF
jgi:hypothetical protein